MLEDQKMRRRPDSNSFFVTSSHLKFIVGQVEALNQNHILLNNQATTGHDNTTIRRRAEVHQFVDGQAIKRPNYFEQKPTRIL